MPGLPSMFSARCARFQDGVPDRDSPGGKDAASLVASPVVAHRGVQDGTAATETSSRIGSIVVTESAVGDRQRANIRNTAAEAPPHTIMLAVKPSCR